MRTHGRRTLYSLALAAFLSGVAVVGAFEAAALAVDENSPATPSSATSTSATPDPASEPDVCAVADALADGGRFETALAEYLKLNEKTPGLPCVVSGVELVVPKMNAVEAAGLVTTCNGIVLFHEMEAWEVGRKAYEDYIAKNGSKCGDLELSDFEPEKTFGERLKAAAPYGVVVVVVPVALALALLLLRQTKWGRRLRRRWWKPQLKIGDIKSPKDGGPAIFGGDLATALLRPDIDEDYRDAFHIVDDYQDLVADLADIPKLNATLEPIGAGIGLVAKALGRDRWNVGGNLAVSSGDAPARLSCAVTFKSRGTIEAAAEFFVSMTDTKTNVPNDVELAVLRACLVGWVRREVSEQAEADLPPTPSSQAYGWLRGGIDAQELGRSEQAEDCYQQAGEVDANYLRAVIARALVRADMQRDSLTGMGEAVRILEDAPSRDTQAGQGDTTTDTLRLRYALAAARTHLAIKHPGDLGAKAEILFTQARTEALDAAEGGRAWVHTQHVPREDNPTAAAAAVKFVTDALAPACDVLAAGVSLCLYDPMSPADLASAQLTASEMMKLAEKHDLSYRVRYNLACFWSTWLDQVPAKDKSTPIPDTNGQLPVDLGLRQLRRALTDAPGAVTPRLAEWAATGDVSLAALRLEAGTQFGRTVDDFLPPES